MNKEIVACIQAEKDRQAREKQKKEELIQKIYDFFKDLPDGEYRIDLIDSVEVKEKVHWYSKYYVNYKHVYKNPSIRLSDYIRIKKKDKIEIKSGSSGFDWEISKWNYDEVKIFYDNLDWFEKQLEKEYCS